MQWQGADIKLQPAGAYPAKEYEMEKERYQSNSGQWWQYDHCEYFGTVSIMIESKNDETANESFEYNSNCSMC